MKRILTGFLACLFIVLPLSSVFAQEEAASDPDSSFVFEQAYEDYIFASDNYRAAYDEYERARAAYLSQGTLKLQNEAQVKTYQMLVSRAELMRVYLTALRIRVLETPGLTDEQRTQLFTNIDAEVLWFQFNKNEYSASDSLDALVTKSNRAYDRYSQTTERIIYDTLFNLSLAKLQYVRTKEETLLSDLKREVEFIETNGDKDVTLIKRWFTQIQDLIDQSKQSQEVGEAEFSEQIQKRGKFGDAYADGITYLENGYANLTQARSYLEEIVREIKLAD